MKTILHLIESSGPGGAEKMLIHLIENLDPSRYRSIVGLLQDGWLNAQLKRRGIATVIIPQRRGLHPGWIVDCRRSIRREKVDLLHTHEFAMNVYGFIASVFAGIPIITTVHGKSYYADRRRRRFAYRLAARRSSPMVAVSEDIRLFLIDAVHIRPTRLVVLYNGIDPEPYCSNVGRVEIRRELGIKDTTPVIGTIGNLYPVKGHIHLIRAAGSVIRLFPEAIFAIIGRGELLGQLLDEAGALGIEKNVRFLGFREDVPAFLQGIDLFAFPSLSEGLPLSLLEAMAAGKPVVATNVGGNPEVVMDGVTGFLVPPADPDGLASKLVVLLRDPSLARQFGENGRRRIHEHFALERMVRDYERLYEQNLSEGAHVP